ncbi:MAG: restriction endonuclease subunit S [Candidatus Marinimicrobia bacterium]|jgi:type I restriction enzyme S subunit|nr:restriction endonuclease subunit S [Candidatus Neomarinimicrobiota bacterium]MBT3950708.1 restriction endonuclease subunit S [Candidatus Neomarinimicrobiota bacterium]MBT4253316.1 restriction endonuclease subunit S [Candidatus Neomarinimicrobiota bacterium]MBT5235546.1 restriction endonuclease subunit S [Candidatus Neomarinimicrobiota bacterium]MBT5787354.1 restriction endonuclease subunit S [Candidatus Neomarinimicrobiota bacterium]
MTVKASFKQTEVGTIPIDWEVKNVGDVTQKVGSGITPRGGKSNYKANGRPFVRSQNVGWGNLRLQDMVFIEDETHATFQSTELLEGDVLLNITGASIGRSAVVNHMLVGGNVNQHVCIIRVVKDAIASEYINYLLLSHMGQSQVDSFQAGGNREGLNFGQIRSIQFPIPPTKAEQEAIAKALSDADAYIESLEKLIAKKLLIKQGAMRELLTGKRRLPGFSGSWSKQSLGKICQIVTGKKDVNEGNPNGRFPFFTCSRSHTYSDTYTFDTQAILIAGNGDVGNLHYYSGRFEAYQRTYVLHEFTQNVQFLWHHLNAHLIASLGIGTIGSSIPYIKKENLTEYMVDIPATPLEAVAIARILSDIDKEIKTLKDKLSKAIQLKKGMMQELLTGRIRLV